MANSNADGEIVLGLQIAQTTQLIQSQLNQLSNDVLMEYINKRIKELDTQASVYRQQLSELSPLENSEKPDVEQLKDYMAHWDELDIDSKREVVDYLILEIKATEDSYEIKWRI